MTSLLRSKAAAAFLSVAAASLVPSPAMAAAADPAERAVAACRAELAGRFAEGEIRQSRIASITGNSRRTRVSFIVTADRRYTFECAAGRDGSIALAALDPPRGEVRQLAAGQR